MLQPFYIESLDIPTLLGEYWDDVGESGYLMAKLSNNNGLGLEFLSVIFLIFFGSLS